MNFFPEIVIFKHSDTHNDVRVAADELTDTVHRGVSAQQKRRSDQRRTKSVVDNNLNLGIYRSCLLTNLTNVKYFESRIRDALKPDKFGLLCDFF